MKKFFTLLALMCLSCIGAWADSMSAILAVSTNETTPEYQYKVQPRNANYWWSSTTTTCNNIDNAGKFAFFAAEGEGNYYIYSVDAQQWLSYDKAASYTGKRNFVTLVDDKASANFFKAVKGLSTSGYASNDKSGYTFSPYKTDETVASQYLNWYEGAGKQSEDDKVGVYGTQWGDAGSVWIMIPADDATKTKSVELWRAEIESTINIVGIGYSSADYASTESLSFDGILTWKANHSPVAFDPTKLYRVWNNSQVQGCSWTIGNNGASVAWAARDNDDNTQVWKFVQVDAENEYKYIIQNYGTPTAFMPNYLQGNSFHAHSVAKSAGKYAITASNNGFYQIHYGSAIGQYAFADGDNHLDGWQGDGKDKWYLELVDVDEYTIASGNTETLSSILTTHENVGNIIVAEGATLNIDADMTDFNMARITTCPGANVTISNTTADIATILGHTNVTIDVDNYTYQQNKVSVATGKLTINTGKKLSIGSGEGSTNSVASFTSVQVNGTLWHNNKNGVLHDVTLNNGTVHSEDMNGPGGNAATGTFENALVFEGTTTVTGNSYILAKWNSQYDIKKLAGDGTLYIRGNGASVTNTQNSETMYFAIREAEDGMTTALDVYNTAAQLVIANGVHIKNNLRVNTANVTNIKLMGDQRIETQGNVTIDGIVANDLTAGDWNYALVQGGVTTLNLKGNVDFCHKSNGEANAFNMIGYQSNSTINVLEGANVLCGGAYWSPNSTTSNAPINIAAGAVLATNNNIISANGIENNGSIKADKATISGAFVATSSITGENFNVVLTNEALNALAVGEYTVVSSGENAAINVTVNGESEFLAGSGSFTVAKDNNNIKLTKAADDLYVKAQEYESYIGTGLGKYHFNETETSGLMDAVEATTTTASRSALVNSIAINQPATGKFYRFKSGEKYMSSDAGNDNVRTMTADGTTNKSVFYLADDAKLIAYADGLGFNYGYCKAAVGVANTFDFSEGATLGSYNIHSNAGSGDTTWSDRNIIVSGDKLTNGTGGAWTIEEVEELPATIATAGYGTFFTPVPVRAADGVKVYTATVTEGETPETTIITYTPLEGGEIPANTAVLVKGGAGTTIMTIIDAASNTVSENALIGKVNTEATPTQGEGGKYIYTLTSSGAFKYYTGASLAGFKCHLELGKNFSNAGGASNFRVVFEDGVVTGIDSAANDYMNNTVFDLQGRRVMNAKSGLYIVNGKKVVR